ncbi:MAG TPA: MerR family transcriptional regulator [Puia sp.]|nr:MerR family transcriptional regulator [Puia sp.]
MSKLTQIALDFGEEPQSPPPAARENGAGSGEADPLRPYMAAGGVGVRVKSYKQTPPAPPNSSLFDDAVPESPEASSVPVAAAAFVERMPEPEVVLAAPMAANPGTEEVESGAESGIDAEILPARVKRPAVKTVKQGPSKRGRKSLKQVSAEADLIEIPVDEVLFSKQYYTMGEVSEMFRVNQSLLRFWETEFDILQPRKNKKGDRYFRPIDIKNLHLIYHLLRQRKYTIEGAKEFLKKNKKAEERFEVIQRLQQIKAFLLEWKAQL